MKKLKLNLDDLKVESFETTASNSAKKGTIFGQSGIVCYGTFESKYPTCLPYGTCDDVTWGECETVNYGCTSPAGGCGGGGTKPHQSTCANTCEIDCL